MIPIPFVMGLLGNWQRVLIYAVVAAALAATVWMHGYFKGKAALYEYQAEQARAGAAIVVKQGAATERVVNRYIKVKGDTQVVTLTVEKEVVRYADSNPGLCLDAGWRRLHDAAALNAVPVPAAEPDGEGRAAPPAALALQAVAENYAACHRTADRLDALQDWAREQHQVTQ